MRLHALIIVVGIYIQGCSSSTATPTEPVVAKPITADTILPQIFAEKSNYNIDQERVRVPESMLRVSTVKRPVAEMREGPGAEFKIMSRLIPQGHNVVIFERVGIWQKVFDMESETIGWVHYQTLNTITLSRTPVEIDLKRLPRVISVRTIDTAFDYKTRQALKVDIPKGQQFLGLSWQAARVLVYLADSNSVVWLKKEDAQ